MKNVKYYNVQEDPDDCMCGCKPIVEGITWVIEHFGSFDDVFMGMMGYDETDVDEDISERCFDPHSSS